MYNELSIFDPRFFAWTDLSTTVQGTIPAGRSHPGMSAMDASLYIFGGRLPSG